MALTVSYVGNNPSVPLSVAESFIPDQLIAGHLPIVTDSVTIGGSAALRRGSLLGVKNVSTPVTSTGKTAGSGTIQVIALPNAGDTVTVQGTVITFVANDPQGNQVLIGYPQEPGFPPLVSTPTTQQQIDQTALNLAGFLSGSTDTNLVKMTYSLNTSNDTITATATVVGTAGNAFTLATSNSGAFTLSGATLTGGTANAGTATIGSVSVGANTKTGRYTVVLTSATVGNVFDPNGDQLGTMTMGTAFTSPQINFTITTGGSPAAGDIFQLYVPTVVAPVYVLATAGATDGSQNPSAILLDYADASGGNVTSVVALHGEFNSNVVLFGAGLNAVNTKAALAANGIFLKSVVSAADPI